MRLVLATTVVTLTALAGCSRHVASVPHAPTMATLPEGQIIGQPHVFGDLTIFPLLADKQRDVGPLTTLSDALAKGEAVVREVEVEPLRLRERLGDDDETSEGGPQVNTLVIENHGLVPLYVLAGTVVEGGDQDREIAEDFIVAPRQTVPVEAFCVESGRWTTDREGHETNGRFGTARQLATGRVRAAGQYQRDQEEVWLNVAKVNEANDKHSESGSLAATLDDDGITRKRAELAGRVDAYLQSLPNSAGIVGIAYAVGGEVHAVRVFANHRVWDMFRVTLVTTAAGEAVTAENETKNDSVVSPVAVAQFVAGVDETKAREERATGALNVNDYRETTFAYGSHTMMKPNGNGNELALPISADYLRK